MRQSTLLYGAMCYELYCMDVFLDYKCIHSTSGLVWMHMYLPQSSCVRVDWNAHVSTLILLCWNGLEWILV